MSGILAVDLFSSAHEPGESAAFLILLALLVSFVFIRTSARLMRSPKVSWWPGSIETKSGLHVHHLVFGIVLMLVSGFVGYATDLGSPWWQLTSIAFGIGAGLTLDEYALWLHLDDVYWSEEGRSSVDAVLLAAMAAGLVVVGVKPLGLDDPGSVAITIGIAIVQLIFVGITFMKGRTFLGVLAFFLPVLGLWGTFRLARPGSPWAKMRYDEAKLGRARQRWADDRRGAHIGRQLRNALGGRPSEADTA